MFTKNQFKKNVESDRNPRTKYNILTNYKYLVLYEIKNDIKFY